MRTIQRSITVFALTALAGLSGLTALGGCGGSASGGGGSVSGSVGGTSFTVASQIGLLQPATSSSNCTGTADGGETCTTMSSGTAYAALLTNRAAATCALIQDNSTDKNFANFDVLQLLVGNDNGAVTAGTYDIVSPSSATTVTSGASASFSTTNAACASGVSVPATAGSITVTEASSSSFAGTYSVTFGTAGSFTGSFNTSICVTPDGGASEGSGVCQP